MKIENMFVIPNVIEKSFDGERHYDIFSLLLNERIILLTGEIDDNLASVVVAQILYLASKDEKKDIQLYINSPGGSVTAGMAIYDTMKYVKNDISTICIGLAASMGAFLLSSGTKGKRYALPNSEIMIHQPLGGVQGQVSDIEISTKRLLKVKNRLNTILASNCDKSLEVIQRDTERDYYLDANEAKEYGLVDKIA